MFEKIRNLFRKESKTAYSVFLANQQAQWSKRDFAHFADEGYKKNVIAFQAINKKAKAVAQIPWAVETPDGKEVIDTPINKALENPNPVQGLQEWIEATVGYYCISGNIYWERTDVTGTTPPEFFALRPDRMHVKIGEDGVPSAFEFKIANKNPTIWEGDELALIRHIKTFNPLDDVYGMSPIEAAAYSIDTHNESSKWLQALLQNGASPSGAVQVDREMSEEEFNRLKAEIDEKMAGGANAGRALLLEGGMKWQQMGLSPQNMSIIESKFSSSRDIALAFEVPPLLLNIPGDSTYSNYKEARQAFYEEAVIPLAQLLVNEFNQWNKELLNGNKVVLKLDEVPAIVEKQMARWEMADKSTDLTINERREIKGYEKIKGGDTIYINSSQIPLTFDQDMDTDEPTEVEAEEKASQAYGKKSDK